MSDAGDLLLDDTPLVLLPKLARLVGLKAAVVLQQIYWIGKHRAPQTGWVQRTYPEWKVELFGLFSVRDIQRMFERLERDGLVEVEQPGKTDRTKHYRVNIPALTALASASRQFGEMELANLASASRQSGEIALDTRAQDPVKQRDTPQPPEGGALSPDQVSKQRERAEHRQRVFSTWDESRGGTGRVVLDDKRRKLIDRALDHYPLQDVLDAVRGWQCIPHNRGENDRQQVYNDLGLLLRNSDNVERFRDAWRRGGGGDAARLPAGPQLPRDDTDRKLREAEL